MTTLNQSQLPKLHVITDPYCGWCYAAAPLLDATVENIPELTIELHCGGMLTGDRKVQVNNEFRDFVMMHNERIEKMTGQPFGKAYYDGLLKDNSAVFDSLPPSAAILAAEALEVGKGFAMMNAQQLAHCMEGLQIVKLETLQNIAEEIGLNRENFTKAYQDILEHEVEAHIEESRNFLQQLGGRGFPTFALEIAENHWQTIDLAPFLGQVEKWEEFLQGVLAQQTDSTDDSEEDDLPFCGLDGKCN